MDQAIKAPGRNTGYDATGPYWVVGLIQVMAGRVRFLVDGRLADAPRRAFVMVMPPHSVVSAVLENARTLNFAAFSRGRLPEGMPKVPIAFPIKRVEPLRSMADVEAVLRGNRRAVPISRSTRPHPLSEEVKARLGQSFQESSPLSVLARELGSSPAVLSRLFRRDWGKPPVQFRNWLRVMESFRHLAEQKAVTDTAFEAGFNDLSRFHSFSRRQLW
ncbi:MAG: AraC family transcriptional regulator [Elusimicrobia bacterium]|nr:AraC family transcriptional regulator [Elusimicrobiota bacterium]